MRGLDTKVNIFVVLLIISWIGASCATFGIKEPVGTAQGKFQTIITPNQQVKTDFLTQEEVKKHFGVDLYQAGVQTLNVEIQSRENRPLNTTLDDITLNTQTGSSIKPLSIDQVTERIHNFTKYRAAFNQALIKAGMYGLGGAALGAAIGATIGAAAGSATAAEGAALGAAIGAAAGTATGVAKGALEAQRKTPEEIKKNLMNLIIAPGKLEGTNKKGLVFFEIMPEQRDISRLVVKLTEIDTRQKLDLELELQRGVSLPQEKYVTPTPLPEEPIEELKSAYVKRTGVNIRTGAGTKYEIVAKVNQGDEIKIIEEKEGWYHVRLPDGKEGWIAEKLTSEGKIEKAAPPKTKEEIQTAAIPPADKEELLSQEWIIARIPPDIPGEKKGVDVKEGPGTTYTSIAKVMNGTKVKKLGKSGEWYKVRLFDGKVGWIDAVYIEEVQEVGKRKGKPAWIIVQSWQGKDLVEIRSAPNPFSQVIEEVKVGIKLQKLEDTGNWVRVKISKGEGYIYKEYVKGQ